VHVKILSAVEKIRAFHLPMSSDESEISFADSDDEPFDFEGPFDKPWDDLEDNLQSAALLLGYVPGTWPKIIKEWPDWDDLSAEEQEAAEQLQLDEDSWPPKEDVFALEWDELDEDIKTAALALGYSESVWPSCDRDWPEWDDLTMQEEEAATALGLDSFNWPPAADDEMTTEDLFATAEIGEADKSDT
jgi:hypothetical protein